MLDFVKLWVIIMVHKKAWAIAVLLVFLVIGGIFAQENYSSDKAENNSTEVFAQDSMLFPRFSVEITAYGAGLRYEHFFTEKISLGALAFFNVDIFRFRAAQGFKLTVRYYILNLSKWFFYAELGLGLGSTMMDVNLNGHFNLSRYIHGVLFSTTIGSKIFVGKRESLFMNPFINFLLSPGRPIYRPRQNGDSFAVNTHLRLGVGVGYAW